MRETATPKDLLRKYGVRPRKRFSQSFLTDLHAIDKIVMAAGITGEDTVVEIGAGLGVMTALIAGKAGRVIALEIDRVMVSILKEELRDFGNVSILEKDVLTYEFSSSVRQDGGADPPGKLKIVGNIPYHISSPILFHLLDYRRHIDSMTLLLQKEVAERITAPPGTKAYGTLSAILAMYFETVRAFSVPSACFYPRPKVDSAVIRMTVRENPAVPLKNGLFFQKVVRAAFAQRRKTLINNLKSSTLWSPSNGEDMVAVLNRLGIDGMRRGETLSVEEFGRLSNELFLQQKA
jgi:16S rRNA (adenine1518-N6/adenine1519-N6)-dimethyltransferase